MSTTQRFEINWFAAAGSALGAVSSAVLLSSLGAAGTLIGAALGSLVITVGGSIYTQSLQKTKAQVDRRRSAARSGRAASSSNDAPRTGSTSARAPRPHAAPLGETLRGLPWKRIVGFAVGLFVAAMAVILVFELSTGRPVSSFTGGSSETLKGTTLSGLQPRSDPESPAPTPTLAPTPTPTSSAPPAEVQPTREPPTGQPTVGATPVEPPASVEPPSEAPATVEPPAPVEPPTPVAPPAEPQPTVG
ncbi:hypothetical protein [Tessaracoccus sp.]